MITLIEKRIFAVVIAVLVLATSACYAQESKEITAFTAASLTGAFTEIGQMYKNETNISVVFNFDGSQVLRTQIENGAYADIFVSANTKQMNLMKNEGFMNNSSITVFTRTKPVIIVPKDNPAKIQNISDLAKPGLKIVIGTKDVPIGDYTLQILAKLANDSAFGPGFTKKVMANVVSNETNVNYITSKVALGEADAGFAYKSDITKDLASKITKIEIPDKYNVIAEYPMGILKQSKYPAQAQEFINLVKSDKGMAVLEKYGFEPVISPAVPVKAASNATAPKATA
ncbi:MAG: molybdate ABC transporter substrate-binding protein [Methanotrichaceae archaeon]|jgi:molybdate transport system substrate-binding protein